MRLLNRFVSCVAIAAALVWAGATGCFNSQASCHVSCQREEQCHALGAGYRCLTAAGLCAAAGDTCGLPDGGQSPRDAAGADVPLAPPPVIDATGGGFVAASGGAAGFATGGAPAPASGGSGGSATGDVGGSASGGVDGMATGGIGGASTGGAGGLAAAGTAGDTTAGMGGIATGAVGGVPTADGGIDSMAGGGQSGAGGVGDGSMTQPGDCTPTISSAPTMFCSAGKCLVLAESIRTGLALWLDSSNIGPVGSRTSTWCDQSGKSNHAYAINPDALPLVTANGFQLADGMQDAGFVIPNDPSIDLRGDDFLILLVAQISNGNQGKSFFRKSNSDYMFPKIVALDWIYSEGVFRVAGHINNTDTRSLMATDPGVPRLYGLRRASDRVEIRVNGQIQNALTELSTPGASTENDGDVLIGQFSAGSLNSLNGIGAVVVVRGALDSSVVGQLEAYLIKAYSLLP